MGAIRVLVVDDDRTARAGLCHYVTLDPDLALVGEAADGARAVTMAAAFKPDVVLLDIQMPVMDGIEATPLILGAAPNARVLALTGFTSSQIVGPVLRADACGYVVKDSEPEVVVDAIKRRLRAQQPADLA